MDSANHLWFYLHFDFFFIPAQRKSSLFFYLPRCRLDTLWEQNLCLLLQKLILFLRVCENFCKCNLVYICILSLMIHTFVGKEKLTFVEWSLFLLDWALLCYESQNLLLSFWKFFVFIYLQMNLSRDTRLQVHIVLLTKVYAKPFHSQVLCVSASDRGGVLSAKHFGPIGKELQK